MAEVTVVDWISYGDALEKDAVIGGMGGWFGRDRRHQWEDYVDDIDPKFLPYYEALRSSVVEKRVRRGGDWHQDSPEGVPLFSDGTVAIFTFRGWGDLMAAVWTEEDNRRYNYMDFYMDSLLPAPEEVEG